MPDLTQGYLGPGKGNQAIVDAIFRVTPLNVSLPVQWLSKFLFTNNFMPYAKSHWAYEGSLCNCEHLSSALNAVWSYVKGVKRPKGLEPLPAAEKVSCLGTISTDGIITKAERVFAGVAHGNVRAQTSGLTDGRCLFPVHWVCKIGTLYFDPTYDRFTTNPEDIVQRKLTKLTPGLWISKDRQFLYAHNWLRAPQFSDSWNEMNASSWISSQDWKAKTARSFHTRSGDLQKLDAALQAFEQQGADALAPLKTAFKNWHDRNPKEASSRNVDGCVTGLAKFLS